ncbi:MAG: glycoside hydrolase family 172 protein [Terracidiphilus sp.]
MHSSLPPEGFPARRRLLGAMASVAGVSAAGLLGLNPADAGGEPVSAGGAAGSLAAAPPPPPAADAAMADELVAQARLRSYKSRRSSSWDRTGGNDDWVRVEAGKSATLLDVTGPGVITHIWFTINSQDDHHLKNLVLRAWWDGESSPSVEAPIGDFYGLGLGEYFTYESAYLAVAPVKALNAYFQMPFESAAKVTLTNEGPVRTDNLYFAVDYVTLPGLPADVARFHAQYRQAAPAKGWSDDWKTNGDHPVGDKPNLEGTGNYAFMEATGRGHFVGVTHSIEQNQDGWFGEGDDMIFIDGDVMPTINGTGTEDYYNGAWDFGGRPFAYRHNGAPLISDPHERIGGRYCLYRWHSESPITFEKSIKVTIEHGHANHRSDNFYSVAYWYQTEPHAAFPKLPPAADRWPRVFAVGGPGVATPEK